MISWLMYHHQVPPQTFLIHRVVHLAPGENQLKLDSFMHNTAAAKPSDDMISSKSETQTVHSESCQSSASDIEILHQNCPTAFDIGLHYNNIKDLRCLEKFDLLNNVWKPSEKFKFPCDANS